MTACLAKHTDGALEAAPEIDVNAPRVPPRPAHLPVSGVGLLVLRFAAPLRLLRLTCETGVDERRAAI